jgi:putative redox protein
MKTALIRYIGDLRTVSTHLKSGEKIMTDAPPDNLGKGEFFSPTDLIASAFGSCALTIMGIASREHKFSIEGAYVEVTKIMTTNPRKIGEIILDFYFPNNKYTEKEKNIIKLCAETCPVSLSLNSELKKTINLHF